ncbi:MAG: four helix bundle protein [Bacteroidota bacterium]
MSERIKSYRDLRVYKAAFEVAMEIFEITKDFPVEEKYSMVDQARKASRSVCANIGEAWRKRRYKAAFVAKLSDSETEACESQVWMEFAYASKYIEKEVMERIFNKYEKIIGQIVRMIHDPDKWLIR